MFNDKCSIKVGIRIDTNIDSIRIHTCQNAKLLSCNAGLKITNFATTFLNQGLMQVDTVHPARPSPELS